MAGLRSALVLLSIFIFSCSSTPKRHKAASRPRTTTTTPMPMTTTTQPLEYEEEVVYDLREMEQEEDQCPYTRAQPLYDEISNVAKTILDPDYDLLYEMLFMRFGGGTSTEVRYKNIKNNLDSNPITIFSNLTLRRRSCPNDYWEDYRICEQDSPKLGELLSDMIMETYSEMVVSQQPCVNIGCTSKLRNLSPPTDLTKTETFKFDKSRWTLPWMKEKLFGVLFELAYWLEGSAGPDRRLNADGQAMLQRNDVDSVLQVVGELANNMIHSNLNLQNLNYIKGSILSEIQRLPRRQLLEENINKAVDCWYETDGFFHIEEGAEAKIPLLQAMIEVVPKDRVKEVFRSWSKASENVRDLEVTLDKLVRVLDQKIQEFDVPRMINLFRVRIENIIQFMQTDIVGGRNLLQRVQKLSQIIDKAKWRMKSGLWPEMINFLDRLVLSLKTKDINDNYLTLWKDFDDLLSPVYHELKTEYYQNALIKELFSASRILLGGTKKDFWGSQFAVTYLPGLQGQLGQTLYNVFVNPHYNLLSEALKFTRKINVVESEKWIETGIYKFLRSLIETGIGGAVSGTHWTLRDGLAALERKGFMYNFFQQDLEEMPRELETLMEVDWQTYFVYLLNTIIEPHSELGQRLYAARSEAKPVVSMGVR